MKLSCWPRENGRKIAMKMRKRREENETLSPQEREPSTHTHGLYIRSRRSGK
jgi:hypothetical protein